MLLSFSFFLFFLFYFEFFKKFLFTKILSVLLGGFIFYLLLYNVTYNSDWDMYEAIFEGHIQSNDFLFNYISQSFYNRGYEYSSVYKLHILLMGFAFIYFSSKFSYSNICVIICTYLLLQLVPLSNQIRYYVAFSFFLIAIYNLIISKNKSFFTIFAILSLISHFAILLMFPFVYLFYNTKSNKYIRNILFYSLILSISFYFIFSIGALISFHFGSYFGSDLLSSFSGGILNNFIWLFWFLLIYKINKRLIRINLDIIESDIKYQFLYKLSLYSVIFFPISIFLQIIAHRYIAASLIVWIIYIFYSLNYIHSLVKRTQLIFIFYFLVILTFLYIYILPTYLLGVSGTEAVLKLLISNKLIFILFQ